MSRWWDAGAEASRLPSLVRSRRRGIQGPAPEASSLGCERRAKQRRTSHGDYFFALGGFRLHADVASPDLGFNHEQVSQAPEGPERRRAAGVDVGAGGDSPSG
jgi:hypothetical protein